MVKYQFTSSDIIIERKDVKDDIINEQKNMIEKLKQENLALKLELLNLKLDPISSIQTKHQFNSEQHQPIRNNRIQFTREIDSEKKAEKNDEQEIVEIINSLQDQQKEEQIQNSIKEQYNSYYTGQSLDEICLQDESDSKQKKQENDHQKGQLDLENKGNLDQVKKSQNENSSYDIDDQ